MIERRRKGERGDSGKREKEKEKRRVEERRRRRERETEHMTEVMTC